MAKPTCRICGCRVEYFGAFCADDEPNDDYEDGLMDIVNADIRMLRDKADN